MEVIFHRMAAREYVGARTRFEEKQQGLGLAFAHAVNAAVQLIVDNPDGWPTFRKHYRWVLVKRFRYVLYYKRKSEDRIVNVAVAHGRRRLGYWTRRKS
jgi:hypothetical protein